MKRLLYLLPLFMAACGSDTASDSASALTNKNYTQALTSLNAQLLKNPADGNLHAQIIVARIGACIAENCFDLETYADIIPPIQTSLPLAHTEPSNKAKKDDSAFSFPQNLQTVLAGMDELPNPLTAYQKLLALQTNDTFSTAVTRSLLATIHTQLLENWTSDARQTIAPALQNMVASKTVAEPTNSLLGLVLGLTTNNASLIRTQSLALKRNEKTAISTAWELLPAAYLHYELQQNPTKQASGRFIQNFYSFLENQRWNANHWNPTTQETMGHAMTKMRRHTATYNTLFTHQQGLGDTKNTVATVTVQSAQSPVSAAPNPTLNTEELAGNTAESPLRDETSSLNLHLRKLVLVFSGQHMTDDTARSEIWEIFLKQAATYIESTGDTTLIRAPLHIGQIPKSQHGRYRNAVFTAMDIANKQGENIAPYLSLFENLELDKPTQVRLEKTIQTALETSVERKQIDRVITYSRSHPELAKAQRQNIVPLMLDDLRAAFANNNFKRVVMLNNVLASTLGIEFNLENILLQAFDTHLAQENIATALSAETPAYLIQPKADVAYDLGPKFAFLRTHFASLPQQEDTPDVINNVLKALVLQVNGLYGVPNALYRLDAAFNNEDFPAAERNAYLVSTLRNAIGRNENLAGIDVLKLGATLLPTHPELSPQFIVNEVLGRLETEAETREIWALLNQPKTPETTPHQYKIFHQTIASEQPDFIALMQGIDAFEAKDFANAVSYLSDLQVPYYVQMAAPYAKHYTQTRAQFRGIYAVTPLVNGATPLALLVVGHTDTPTTADASNTTSSTLPPPSELSNLPITLINRIGSHVQIGNNELVQNHGIVKRTAYPSKVDFSALALQISDQVLINQKLYGSINRISRQSNGDLSLRTSLNAQPIHFTRISHNPAVNLAPAGTYSINKHIAGATVNTTHMLPAGAKLTFTTKDEATKIGTSSAQVYEVSGTLTHPAKPNAPQTVTGIYNPNTHLTSLRFSYPLPNSPTGETIDAYARCQILPETLLCAGHNAHNIRQQYHHVVAGQGVE